MTVITGAANIEFARVLAVRSALRIEIRTGMRRSSRGASTLQLANHILDANHKNKTKAYEALNAYIVECGGADRPLS